MFHLWEYVIMNNKYKPNYLCLFLLKYWKVGVGEGGKIVMFKYHSRVKFHINTHNILYDYNIA